MNITTCPCCGNKEFQQTPVLWPGLVSEWGLSERESEYIDRQQGFACTKCAMNLRTMTLAACIMKTCGFEGTFEEFVKSKPRLKVLEVNEAGYLHPLLKQLPNHTLAVFPKVDLMDLPYKDASYDFIVHSDTLEHIPDPLRALSETLRVLRPGGATCYTIPLVVGRLSKKRGKAPSYHGSPGNKEYLVCTEYGSDMWTQLLEVGFEECRLLSLDYPASVGITGIKARARQPVNSRFGALKKALRK